MLINKCGGSGLPEKKLLLVSSIMSKIASIRPRMFLLLALPILTLVNNSTHAQSQPGWQTAPPAYTPKISDVNANTDRSSSKEQPLSVTLYDCGHPTNEEQYQLELINRARANPDSEGIWLATDTD